MVSLTFSMVYKRRSGNNVSSFYGMEKGRKIPFPQVKWKHIAKPKDFGGLG
jgi:hypothetical protein